MHKSIICGIDGSQAAHWAARVAAALARELDHRLILVYVAEEPRVFPYGDARLGELARRDAVQDATGMLERVAATLPGVVPETRVRFGDPEEALTAVSGDEAPELLVVGSRGLGPLAAALRGSVSTRLASAAECPVLIVPSPEAADRFLARPRGSRVLCGVDDSAGSIRALRLAAGLAERLELELLPVHIDSDGTWEDAPFGVPAGDHPRLQVYRGEPVEGLRRRASDDDASMIVVGSRGRAAWHAAALGSVSGALAATAPAPVLVVPATARPTHLADGVPDATVAGVLSRVRHWTANPTKATNRTKEDTMSDRMKTQTVVGRRPVGRFSTGIEQLPDTLRKRRRGRFSTGIEELPTSPETLRVGRFSEGIEQLPETAAVLRRGSFADGYRHAQAPHPKAA